MQIVSGDQKRSQKYLGGEPMATKKKKAKKGGKKK